MGKPKYITVTYNDETYRLGFTRNTITEMELKGFKISMLEKVEENPFAVSNGLFEGAFLAYHKGLDADIIDEIIFNLPCKDKLLVKLIELYSEAVTSLMKGFNNEGNAIWEANF